jgi:predicted acetyltransferase
VALRPRASSLELRLPRGDEQAELLRARDATSDVPTFLHYYAEGMSVEAYVEALQAQARGEDLPGPNYVPSTFLFAFDGPRIVGRVSIRHHMNDHLLRVGGHIGYVVVPEFRRRGYATLILREALKVARERLGIERVLVTCDDDNVGSIRTIEKNGGVLENVVTDPDLPKPKRRYWIDVG